MTTLLVAAAAQATLAQSRASVADSSHFRPLDLPAPNEYRGASGRPGPKYWQQRVDYKIVATLDPAKNELRGRETIHYVNRSPDVLPYLWLHVEQNICEPNSITNQLNQPPLVFLGTSFDFSCQGFNSGPRLESLKIGGREVKRTRFGTTLRVDLPTPLASGAFVNLDAEWTFNVPRQGAGRMGHDGPLYVMAQWYPRVAVYDDVRGWNHEPYIGAGEFYLEYGDFDVSLTVPADNIVAATGELMNPLQVLTPAQRSRLALALRSDTTIAIITAAEAGNMEVTRPRIYAQGELSALNPIPSLTWRFTARNVRDFAFASGPNMRWDASGYDGILIQSLYRSKADKWPEVNRMGREAIKYFSEQWYRYPYSHATTVEGPIEGMEYPMLTFTPNSPTREDQQWVIAHEFGHQWFPMIVGSNERLYPWMDEGFNTFIDLAHAAKYFAGTPYGDTIEVHPLRLYADHAATGNEQPLITKPVEVRDLFWIGYQKPALMMHILRNEVLGKERFDAAFREYIRAWAFKHPTPSDFFRIMRDASGMELDWFWRDWVFTTARLDQAIDSLTQGPDGVARVYLSNRGTMVMPTELAVTFDDGSTTTVKLPVEMWNVGDRFTYRVPGTKRVRAIEADPRRVLPDVDRANNRWPTRTGGPTQPPSNQAQDSSAAVKFAPGVVSTDDVFASTFTPDGKTVVFTKFSPPRPMTLMMSTLTDGTWSAPVPLPFSGTYRDLDPAFSPDGSRLYFSSARPASGSSADTTNVDTWYADRRGNGWSPPRRLPDPVNGPETDMYPSVTNRGVLYFDSFRSQPRRRLVYRAEPGPGGTLGAPQVLDVAINADSGASNLFVDAEERYVVFGAVRPGGAGGSDLYISQRNANGWTTPRSLGRQVNTPGTEFCPFVSRDGKLLYFTRVETLPDKRTVRNIFVIPFSELRERLLRE